MHDSELKERIKLAHRYFKRITAMVEIFISVIVLVGLLISFIPLLQEVPELLGESGKFSHFLEIAFNLVIGIEFLEMLNNHSPGSALEVFLFAIVRHMVIETGSALDMLVGVLAVGLIFAIRKFIYVDSFEDDEEADERILSAVRARREKLRNKYKEEFRNRKHGRATDSADAPDEDIDAGQAGVFTGKDEVFTGQDEVNDGQADPEKEIFQESQEEIPELFSDDYDA